MDTQNLKAFVAVVNQGSFSEAAEQLHLTQSATSKRVANLEHQLNAPLFDRIGRSIGLTEAGKALLPRAREILQSVDDTQQMIDDLSGQVRGQLKVATSHHIGLHRLPKILQRFAQAYPDVQLQLQFQDSEKANQAVIKGEVDMAIITLSDKPHTSLNQQIVWPDPLDIVVSPLHPLAQLTNITIDDLSQYPAVLPERHTHTTKLLENQFNLQGVNLNCSMSTNFMETIKMLLSVGLGWGILPRTISQSKSISDTELEKLSCLKVKGLTLERQLGFVTHKGRSPSNAQSHFVALLTEPRHRSITRE